MDRFSETVVLSTVIVVGALLGSGIAPILANELFSPLPRVTAWRLPPHPAFGGRPVADVDIARLALDPSPQPSGTLEGTTPPAAEAEVCAETLHLVGVAHDLRDRMRSVASVHEGASGYTLRVDETAAGWTLVETEPRRAVLRREVDGRSCSLVLGPSHAAHTAPRDHEAVPDEGPVTRIAENHYAIERSFAESLIAHPRHRVLPFERDGEVVGFRIYGLGRMDPAARGGLRNGDVVTRVDGAPVQPMENLLDAYARLNRGEALRVTVERRGEPVELRYELGR